MTVSVIIPTFNSATFVARAIKSVLAQSLRPSEIILVDNNSTDDTLEVLQYYANKYPDLITVTTETVQGPSAARNKGLRVATGTWIQFLDSDDTLPENKLAEQLRSCPSTKEWIVSGYREIGLNGEQDDYLPTDDLWLGLATGRGVGCSCSNLFRRSLLLAHGGYREDWPDAEDHDLYFRLLAGEGKKTPPAKPWIDRTIRCHVYDRTDNKQSKSDLAGHLGRRIDLHKRLHDYLRKYHSGYYAAKDSILKAYLLNNYRYWAAFDAKKAVDSAEQFFRLPTDWPSNGEGIVPGVIFQAYRLLGFRRAEWIRRYFR